MNSPLRYLIILIFAGEAIFFLPFTIPRIFRPTLLEVYHLSNLQLGMCFSVYGAVAMVSYIFGGPLADRFEARSLLAVALWATSLGGFYAVSLPSFEGLLVLYGYWGFTTIFLFWASLIRATREWGGDATQGRAFGLLEGGRGLVAAIVGVIALGFFAWFMKDSSTFRPVHRRESLQIILLFTSVVISSIGLWCWYGLPQGKIDSEHRTRLVGLKEVITLVRLPTVWMQALMIVCAYVGYKITDDYSLFANQVLEMDQVSSAGISTIAIWLRPVFALSAGFLADRYNGDRVIRFCFAGMALAGGLIYFGVYQAGAIITFTLLTTALLGIYGLRGVYFAVFNQAAVPWALTGTAVGFISFIGFTPDVFMSPIMGYLLDNNPGARGHELVFGVMAVFGMLGWLISIVFTRTSRNLIGDPNRPLANA